MFEVVQNTYYGTVSADSFKKKKRRVEGNTNSAGSVVMLLSDRSSSIRAVKFYVLCLSAV